MYDYFELNVADVVPDTDLILVSVEMFLRHMKLSLQLCVGSTVTRQFLTKMPSFSTYHAPYAERKVKPKRF
jgi:hypothetical protein